MSVDRSLRRKSSLERHRNVLSRAERVTRLIAEERFAEDTSPLGLPKVSHRKAHAGKKKVKKEEAAAAEGGAAPAA
jgi:small basic protein (TIGR04137 family)